MLPWVILIEQLSGSSNAIRWTPELANYSYATRDEARAAAAQVARSHVPQHPLNDKGRLLLQHDEDNYTVMVKGSTMTTHFKVSVVEWIE